MTIKTAPFVVESRLNYSLFGLQAQNVLHFVTPAESFAYTNLASLNDALETWWCSAFAALLSVSITLLDIQTVSLDFDFPFEALTIVGCPGEVAGDALPANVAIRTAFDTGATGRSNRGYAYLGGIPESKGSGNLFDPTYVSQIQEVWEGLNTALSPADESWAHVLLSRFHDKTQRDPAASFPVVSYLTDAAVHSMGRRLDNRAA